MLLPNNLILVAHVRRVVQWNLVPNDAKAQQSAKRVPRSPRAPGSRSDPWPAAWYDQKLGAQKLGVSEAGKKEKRILGKTQISISFLIRIPQPL